MASSSTSFIQKRFKYDVFLSFRGEDTRHTFVNHLYKALTDIGVATYMDDKKIRQGRKISDELINSIQDSKLYVIVFSKDYASSSWCLQELVKIMECQKAQDQTAYPVFYDVEPTEVRKQTGVVGEAFAKHVNEEDAGKWIGAMYEAAGLAGWNLKTDFNGNQVDLIKKIVDTISKELPPICSSTYETLIGMESRVRDVVSKLEIGTNDVRVIGIKGMGGSGKTTLARVVFEQISHMFDDGQSFVANVREVSNASLYGLSSLQKQILSDVSKDQDITVNNVYDGKSKIIKMMAARRVLLVLDDVDHIDQLKGLTFEPKWFKPGSRIIITTRDEKVLKIQGVKLIIHGVNLLSNKEAICLFSRCAFGTEAPNQGYEDQSEQVVHYAHGLPLTITLLGSSLYGEDKHVWEDVLDRLKKIPMEETLKQMEISYTSLENEYKEIFLDVSCLLKGWDKDVAIRALESQGFYGRNGVRVLEQKSLITISKDNRLNMHDRIEEMGKNIVRRLHPDDPSRHSRLWNEAEIMDILANDKGTEATRGIQLRYSQDLDFEIFTRGLRNMRKLRFLYVGHYFGYSVRDRSSWKFDTVGSYMPNSLQCLQWDQFPLEFLPLNFLADNIFGERKVFKKLISLNLTLSKLCTFDFELIPNLETLILADCFNMIEFHIPNGFPKLKFLDLTNSTLRIFNLGPSPDLETLIFNGCLRLLELHMPYLYPKLKSIIIESPDFRYLDLLDTKIVELRPILSSTDEKLVGMASRVEDVYPSLEIGIDDVRVIGIKGTAGSGKTTLARAVFDKISHKFEGQSFIENIRDVSNAYSYDLSYLQNQILSDVFKDKGITINNVYDGKKMMRRMMPGTRVLVVLDDVDHYNQLEELLVDLKWYKPGSRIIVTTRHEQVLLVLGAHGVKVNIIDVNLLSNKESLFLFSKNAFGIEIPIQTYENLSEQVVHHVAGIPLAIKVLASYLSGKDELKWIDTLEELKGLTRYMPSILDTLELVYTSLDDECREIFLDVACLLNGWDKDKAIRTLESQGLYATVGLRVLEKKGIITISEDNCLNVHDHVEEMGKNIVRRLHPDEPWRHSRLWIEEEIKDILANDKGTDATMGIHLRYTQELDPEIFMRGLRNMKKLRFLYVESDMNNFYDDSRSRWRFDKCRQYLPSSLRYMYWDRYPLQCSPKSC